MILTWLPGNEEPTIVYRCDFLSPYHLTNLVRMFWKKIQAGPPTASGRGSYSIFTSPLTVSDSPMEYRCPAGVRAIA